MHKSSYGSTSCWVVTQGIQKWKDFCLNINITKGNFWESVWRCQKVPKFDFQFSISKIMEIFLNFFHWRISIIKIQSFPLGMLIFRQKYFQFCIAHLKTRQSVYGHKYIAFKKVAPVLLILFSLHKSLKAESLTLKLKNWI